VVTDLEQASPRVLKVILVTLPAQFWTAELLQRLLHRPHFLLTLKHPNTHAHSCFTRTFSTFILC